MAQPRTIPTIRTTFGRWHRTCHRSRFLGDRCPPSPRPPPHQHKRPHPPQRDNQEQQRCEARIPPLQVARGWERGRCHRSRLLHNRGLGELPAPASRSPGAAIVGARIGSAAGLCQHPAAYLLMKHAKSRMFRMLGVVEPSQLPQVSPAANLLRKQAKSLMFRIGGSVDPSQLA